MKPELVPANETGWLRSPWGWLALGLAAVYIRGLFLDVMDVDAAQYAALSMEMLQGGNWLQVQYRHLDYLDKPPLLFWTSAASFALFGLHNWAYKLPSLVAAAGGVYALYRFALLFYSRETARNAAFILASSVGAVLMCNDVRTDAMLMGMTMCAVWQVAEHVESGRTSNLLLAGVFVGLAMLAKGPIGIVAPGFAVATHLLLKRDWRRLFQPKWLLGLAVTALVLLPMCWGLYQQFDLHPEKLVNKRTGVSGLYFYFWEQSFGRITGSNVWKDNTTIFTFFHVYLWTFLPWPLLFGAALWRRGREIVQGGLRIATSDEGYSIGGFVLTFAALSLSHYKLPHYILVTLPWASILTARWLAQPSGVGPGWWRAQYVVFGLLAGGATWLLVGVFPPGTALGWLGVVACFGALVVGSLRDASPRSAERLVQRGVLAALGTAFVLNFHFYPQLLTFQSTSAVSRYALANGIPMEKLAYFNKHAPAADFYSRRVLPKYSSPEAVRSAAAAEGTLWVAADDGGRARLDSAGVSYREVAVFQHIAVSRLTGRFLNRSTREKTIIPVYLLRVPAEQ